MNIETTAARGRRSPLPAAMRKKPKKATVAVKKTTLQYNTVIPKSRTLTRWKRKTYYRGSSLKEREQHAFSRINGHIGTGRIGTGN
jgi:hypothetical protein